MNDSLNKIEWHDAHPPHGVGDHPFWRGRLNGAELGVYVCLVEPTGDGLYYTPFSSEGVDSSDFTIDGDDFILAWTDHVAWNIEIDAVAFSFEIATLKSMISEAVVRQSAERRSLND